jgi:nucleotide-binding universal stress UspA family protein
MPILAGLRVETHVHEAGVRDVARSITDHTAELAPDLVVMSIHGTGGARRLLFGTIAQQVIGHGATPVLLVRPSKEASDQEKDWTWIVAPIDGDPVHEKCLPLAAELAAAFSCGLHLLMVIPNPEELTGLEKAASVLLPNATRIKLEMDSAGAGEYVAARAAELKSSGVQTTCEAARGDPALAIVRTARRLAADLVVMGTHGRAGTEAFWEGSVAARVIARSRVPLLLVPLRV